MTQNSLDLTFEPGPSFALSLGVGLFFWLGCLLISAWCVIGSQGRTEREPQGQKGLVSVYEQALGTPASSGKHLSTAVAVMGLVSWACICMGMSLLLGPIELGLTQQCQL